MRPKHDYTQWLKATCLTDSEIREAQRIKREGPDNVDEELLLDRWNYELEMSEYDHYIDTMIDERKRRK